MRFCACMGLPLDIVEPCGFLLTDKNLKRAGMDYLAHLDMERHGGWDHFCQAYPARRRILMTTKGATPYTHFLFQPQDILIAGRESSGVPDYVHENCDAHVVIPMQARTRSLNVALAAAMIMGEALRQTRG